MVQKVLTGKPTENGFNIAANICCGDVNEAPECFYKKTIALETFNTYIGVVIDNEIVNFNEPIDKSDITKLEVAIVDALVSKNYNAKKPPFSPILIKLDSINVTIQTDRMDCGDFALVLNNSTQVFNKVCPKFDVNPSWVGNPSERVYLNSESFEGDGSTVFMLNPPPTANLAEINFLGGEGKYTRDGSDPNTSNTSETQSDDVQFEVEERNGLTTVKLTADTGVTIAVNYYYRPAGFNA